MALQLGTAFLSLEMSWPFLASGRLHEGMHAQVPQRFLAVQEFIQKHMVESITLADLARVAGLNPTYFSDRSQQPVGVRPLA